MLVLGLQSLEDLCLQAVAVHNLGSPAHHVAMLALPKTPAQDVCLSSPNNCPHTQPRYICPGSRWLQF